MDPTDNLKLLKCEGACCVVSRTGRNFPGILLQGDSVQILYADIVECAKMLAESEVEDCSESLNEIAEGLRDILIVYEKTLASKAIPLPYLNPVWHKSSSEDS